jgi:hypothetical protein
MHPRDRHPRDSARMVKSMEFVWAVGQMPHVAANISADSDQHHDWCYRARPALKVRDRRPAASVGLWVLCFCPIGHEQACKRIEEKVGILCGVTRLHAHTLRPPAGLSPIATAIIYIGASKAHCDGRGWVLCGKCAP